MYVKRMVLLFLLILFGISGLSACHKLSLPDENVCYEDHIVPLVKRDCAACHENGEYGIKLEGKESDYDSLMNYISPGLPDNSPLMRYVHGWHKHPVIWPKNSDEYKTVSAWISEGADKECSVGKSDGDLDEVDTEDSEFANESAEDSSEGEIVEVGESSDESSEEPDLEEDLSEKSEPEPETSSVSFSSDIVPMLATDCARCHYGGRYGVRLNGEVADYPEVMRYVDVNDPEGYDSFLFWASGGNRHVVSWPKGGAKYNLFLKWVQEGARNN